MEDLLRYEKPGTLGLWLGTKGLSRFGDLIQNIINYYSYLDILSVPSLDTRSEEVFSNKEIVYNIVRHCPTYDCNSLACVNSITNTVMGECKIPLSSLSSRTPAAEDKQYEIALSSCRNRYTVDSIIQLDWLHMAKCEVPPDSYHVKVEPYRDNSLLLPMSTEYSTVTMLICIARDSNCSDRYYDLFVALWGRLMGESGHTHTEVRKECSYILDTCIIGRDIRMLEFLWTHVNNLSVYILSDTEYYWSFTQDLAYYGKIDFLKRVRKPTDSIDDLVVQAYCGGYSVEMSEYTKTIPGFIPLTANEILYKLFYGGPSRIRMDRFSRFICLVSECEERVGVHCVISFLNYFGFRFTRDDFKELWLVLKDKLTPVLRIEALVEHVYRHDAKELLLSQ